MPLPRLSRLPLSILCLAILMILSAGGGAWLHYRREASRYELELERQLEVSRQRLETLESIVERLQRTRRLAQIIVTRQAKDIFGEINETDLVFVELDEQGHALASQCFTIPGEVAFFDGLVIKFTHDSVATARALEGESIVLLRRVFSERMAPQDGLAIDTPGSIPAAYQVDKVPAEFEKQLWSQFWALANDPELARQRHVRVAQGEAVYKPLRPGALYELTIDADGGLNLETRPLPDAVADVMAAAARAEQANASPATAAATRAGVEVNVMDDR